MKTQASLRPRQHSGFTLQHFTLSLLLPGSLQLVAMAHLWFGLPLHVYSKYFLCWRIELRVLLWTANSHCKVEVRHQTRSSLIDLLEPGAPFELDSQCFSMGTVFWY